MGHFYLDNDPKLWYNDPRNNEKQEKKIMELYDDYLEDLLDRFFSDADATAIVLDNMIDGDDDVYVDELDDVEPTDAELTAIESELGEKLI